ncbi:MAG TPA: hypothetical protein VFN99_09485 [Gaiella sp.]|nr:hypothetical protein [Gaiella sp.]
MSSKSRAAVGAKNPTGASSEERRKQRRDRIALGVAGLLLVVAVVFFAQSRTDTGPPPTPAAALPQPPAQQAPQGQQGPVQAQLKKGGTLEPAARKVAVRFLETAVGRTSLDEAWALSTPELRAGVSLKQWRTGELPVVPFPVQDLETTGFQVLESAENVVLLQVLLVPKPGTAYVPTRYDMTLERASKTAPWKVSYCTPYAPPGIYAAPD